MMSDRYRHARKGMPVKRLRRDPSKTTATHDIEPMVGGPIMMVTHGRLMQALNTHNLFVVRTAPRLI